MNIDDAYYVTFTRLAGKAAFESVSSEGLKLSLLMGSVLIARCVDNEAAAAIVTDLRMLFKRHEKGIR